MKNALIFIAGAIFGILCLYAWQGYRFQRLMMGSPFAELMPDGATSRQSFQVTYGRPVRVENVDTGAHYQLTLMNRGGTVAYTWISAADASLSGKGELFEDYEEIATTPGGRHVEDVGSSLMIRLADLDLEWSSGSSGTGWLYYSPQRVSLGNETRDLRTEPPGDDPEN